jgi:hypothetical protein
VLAGKAAYRKANRDKVRAQDAAWRDANRDKVRAQDAAYKKANREKYNALSATRRAQQLQATPPWLTAEHKASMEIIYREARVLSERGFAHHVDHIVPLRGEMCSGLHVPWNLRAIPADTNVRKSISAPTTLPTIRYF